MPMPQGTPLSGSVRTTVHDAAGRLVSTNAACKVCLSPHRAKVEQWHTEGISVRVISARLQGEGESISGESVRRHLKNHFDVRGATAKAYAKSQALLDAEGQKRLSDIDRLEALAEAHSVRAAEFGETIDKLRKASKPIPMSLVEAYKSAASEARMAIKQKADLLGDQPADGIDRLLAALWGGESVPSAEERESEEAIAAAPSEEVELDGDPADPLQ